MTLEPFFPSDHHRNGLNEGNAFANSAPEFHHFTFPIGTKDYWPNPSEWHYRRGLTKSDRPWPRRPEAATYGEPPILQVKFPFRGEVPTIGNIDFSSSWSIEPHLRDRTLAAAGSYRQENVVLRGRQGRRVFFSFSGEPPSRRQSPGSPLGQPRKGHHSIPLVYGSIRGPFSTSNIDSGPQKYYEQPFSLLERAKTLLSMQRVREAIRILQEGTRRYPHDEKMTQLLHVISPSEGARGITVTAKDRQEEMAWIKTHGRRYRGRWVAIYDSNLIAEADTLKHLLENLKRTWSGQERPLIQYLERNSG